MTDLEFEAAVGRYADSVFRLAYSYLKSRADAEDVMQETLLKLYVTKKPFESAVHERNWVLRVTVNGCKKLLRTPWRCRTEPLEQLPETAVFDRTEQSELFQQVMALPPKYRAAVYLYYYEGYDVRETADLLGANPSTVQTWLMRARGKLKTKLEEAERL